MTIRTTVAAALTAVAVISAPAARGSHWCSPRFCSTTWGRQPCSWPTRSAFPTRSSSWRLSGRRFRW